MSTFKIFHATDLHPDGGTAFEHSVALARDAGASLFTVHARTPWMTVETRPMPDAAALMSRWERSEPVDYTPMEHECCEDPVDTLLDAMSRIHPDLLVVGTHQRGAIGRILRESVSHSLAVNADVPTLFLPIGKPGLLRQNGELALKRVLIPVGTEADFDAAVPVAAKLAERLDLTELEFHLLHVGESGPLENELAPEHDGWTWRFENVDGNLNKAIAEYSSKHQIDLIVMATRGQDGILDVLKGTHTQQVLHGTSCPLLVVPT